MFCQRSISKPKKRIFRNFGSVLHDGCFVNDYDGPIYKKSVHQRFMLMGEEGVNPSLLYT